MSLPFAIVDDIKDRWPSFPVGQESYAGVLLEDASNMLRERWPDIDARVDSGRLMVETVRRVVVGMVKRAMAVTDADGIESRGINTGPFGTTVKYSNPDGNLYLRASDIAALEVHRKKKAFAVDLSQPQGQCY